MLERTINFFELKAITSVGIAILGFMFDKAQAEALVALFILIFIDFLFGITAAKKTGQEIKSAKIFATSIKFVIYFALIAASHISEKALPGFIGFLDESVTGFLVATELLSILENAGRMGYAVPRKVLNQLQEYTEKDLSTNASKSHGKRT